MTQLTCTDRAGRHELTLDLSAFLADDQTDEHAVKLAGEAAERGPGRSSTPPQPPRQDRDIKKRGRDLINAPAEHGMPVTDLQLGRHESRRGSMLCRQRRAHPGRGHPRSLPRPRRPPGHRRRRDTVARHCRFDPRWQRACPAQTPIPGISSATGLPRQATDEDEAVRRTLITRNKEMPAAQQVRGGFLTQTSADKGAENHRGVGDGLGHRLEYGPVDRQLRRTHHARPDCRRRHRPTPALPRDGDRPARRTAVCAPTKPTSARKLCGASRPPAPAWPT